MIIDPQTLCGDWSYPTAICFGPGRIAALAKACRSVGITRPLLVTDSGLAALPMVREAVARNEEAGVPTAVFSDVQSNPVERNVAGGLAAYRTGGHDGVIAMGGGSAMDTGKIIALMAGQEGALWDYEGTWQQISLGAIAPIVAVPTTAGTGSEVGRAAVITHEATRVKKIILHPGMMPRAYRVRRLRDRVGRCSVWPAEAGSARKIAPACHLELTCADCLPVAGAS